MRASDADREQIVGVLGRRFAQGYLSTDTFAGRVDAAYGAKTVDELSSVIGDLPRTLRLGERLGQLVARVLRRLDRQSRLESRTLLVEVPLDQQGEAAVVTIGRGSRCDIVLSDSTVSRLHAQLISRAGGWLIRDLGSTNGTRVNGREVADAEVRRGDELRLGGARLVMR
jgi:FHA domain/Domain of unknown function (DUF1707)